MRLGVKCADHPPEQLVVMRLHNKWILIEERQHVSDDVLHAIDRVHEDIGLPPFVSYSTDAEHAHESFEHPPVAPVLRHLKCWDDLYASSPPHMWISVDRDREATFSVDEPAYPLGMEFDALQLATSGFLLIVPTGRVITAHLCHLQPAVSQIM
jgi:hypothetical protein